MQITVNIKLDSKNYHLQMLKRNLIKRLWEIGIIYKEPVRLHSGVISDFYCDIKKAFGYPDILNALADEIGKKLSDSVNCVAASGYGGMPLASVVASRFNKKLIAVRGIPKKHGKRGLFDGYVPGGKDTVIIIDDVLTTGSSIREIFNILKTTKAKIKSAIVVVKRGETNLPTPYSYLFTIDEIIKN